MDSLVLDKIVLDCIRTLCLLFLSVYDTKIFILYFAGLYV